MKISWKITNDDIQKVKQIISENKNPLFKYRFKRNVKKHDIEINKNIIIKALMMCLLTSQQRSGPNSLVGQFIRQKPFLITIEMLENSNNIQKFVFDILKKNGLNRYINRISSFFTFNYEKLEDSKWSIINELNELNEMSSIDHERKIADKLSLEYKGIGPKQSRNFLQALGLTKYEIPIDSRIIKWLNDFGFPVTLSSTSLSDIGYYHFVSDGIHELCKNALTYPCLLDAAIFSSFDDEPWTEENVIF